MAVVGENGRELVSWQEIADHLGITVRAAQRWERERGLPIRRLPGKRSIVSANRAEVDAWRNSLDQVASPQAASIRRWQSLAGTLFVALACLGWYWFVTARAASPASFRIEQNVLVVLDAGGREAWRATFPTPLNSALYVNTGAQRHFWTGDLDGDGRPEVLFTELPENPFEAESLICFSDRGVVKWRFRPGRVVFTPAQRFTSAFHIADFVVAPLGKGGAPTVVITSHQVPDYPNQAALISGTGAILGEYWHSGYLEQLAVSAQDIYLGGVSNAYGSATLVVLGADKVAGASVEENPTYQLQGFPPAHERARLLFPRSCINRKLEPYNRVARLTVDRESVTASVFELEPPKTTEVWYQLTPDLRLKHFEVSDAFRSRHAELQATRLLDHDLTPGEEKAMGVIRDISTAK
jgi:hypothetical protein